MKIHFEYNPSLYKLGKTLMDVAMSTAIPAVLTDNKWTGIFLMGVGAIGRVLMGLYGKSEDDGTES